LGYEWIDDHACDGGRQRCKCGCNSRVLRKNPVIWRLTCFDSLGARAIAKDQSVPIRLRQTPATYRLTVRSADTVWSAVYDPEAGIDQGTGRTS